MKETHFRADLAMVALLRLFQHMQMLFEIVPFSKRHAVYSLKHLVPGVSAPIGAGNLPKLESVSGNLPGVGEVRASAEVLPVAVPIHAHRFAFGNAFNQFDFVRLAPVKVVLDGPIPFPDFGMHRIFQSYDPFHLSFNQCQIGRRE